MTGTTSVSHARQTDTTRLGILVMLLGVLLFALNDVMGKWLVSTYSVGQLLLIRSAMALIVLLPFVWRMGWRQLFAVERPGLQVTRVVFSSLEVYAFYFAVITLPLADAMTFWMAAPIYVAALSPFLLGEHVGWRRWTAIVVGFCGVVIALEPSSASLTPAALISIFGSLFFTIMLVTSRMLRGTPDTTLVFWQSAGAGLMGLVTAPIGWVTPGPLDLSLLALLGVVAMLGHVCVNRSLKLADAATVVPFQYMLLFWALVFGYVFFGDVPRPAMMTGAAIIVAAGLFIFFREQHQKRRAAA